MPSASIRKLISLGVPDPKAYEWRNTRKKYWRISNSLILNKTLGMIFFVILN